jgi:formylglycine-generating enzyme required for sulfatase activity
MKKNVFICFLFAFCFFIGCEKNTTKQQNNAKEGVKLESHTVEAVLLKSPSSITNSSMVLSWTKSEESDFASYKLYRSTSSRVSQSSTLVGAPITSNTAISKAMTGLSAATKYYFKVYVCNTEGQCTGSNKVNGTTFDDRADNSWITIPAGDFVMGCVNGDDYCYKDQKHTVTLSEYKIQKYEVTNAQYKQCVDAAICKTSWDPTWGYDGSMRTEYYGNATYDNYPMIYVDWNDANTYCGWIGGRLPTEAEWEKAARGPSPREVLYPWGDDDPTCDLAEFDECSTKDTAEVGSHPTGASYYGAMDMAGNVYEWVNDWYDEAYGGPPWKDPQGPGNGEDRVMRGGGWSGAASYLRVSGRSRSLPTSMSHDIGFRCAKD